MFFESIVYYTDPLLLVLSSNPVLIYSDVFFLVLYIRLHKPGTALKRNSLYIQAPVTTVKS